MPDTLIVDSAPATLEHIEGVNRWITKFALSLAARGIVHDQSKLRSPEKEGFDRAASKPRPTYPSAEYNQSLRDMQPTLDHHYAANSHHPEHWAEGVAGMDLLDLVEMFCDWQARQDVNAPMAEAQLRVLEHNIGRFGIDPQLAAILRNTLRRFVGNQPVSPDELTYVREESA